MLATAVLDCLLHHDTTSNSTFDNEVIIDIDALVAAGDAAEKDNEE